LYTVHVYKVYVMAVYNVIDMARDRKETVDFRNVRLSIETYDKLDKYLLELMQKRGNRRLSLDDAVKSLMEYYYSKK
jgi:hypothetical protein